MSIMNTRSPHVSDPNALARPLGDPLGEILHLLKLTGTFYCQSRLTAPWGIDIPAFPGLLTFAMVTGGRCWLNTGNGDPVPVEQGNLLVLTGGTEHSFLSEPGAQCKTLEELPIRRVSQIYETLEYGGGGPATNLIYGIVRIDHAASGMLMELLPDVLKIDTWNTGSSGWLQGTLQFIAREAEELRPGGETVITRLADIVVIEAIRNWINTPSQADKGWLRGVRDPQIGRALVAIHRAPAQDWTVASLADAARMSRSAFAARFTDFVGMSAMRYLAFWRMQLARERLQETSQSIATIAADLGYLSEPAFNRAFKRVFGEPPGGIRRRHRQA
ncbi:MAG: AraC family transcriptional regulator [Nitratireductor sp.]|nr:AraC family transcriptional regulator [Nitratireductor sp.]